MHWLLIYSWVLTYPWFDIFSSGCRIFTFPWPFDKSGGGHSVAALRGLNINKVFKMASVTTEGKTCLDLISNLNFSAIWDVLPIQIQFLSAIVLPQPFRLEESLVYHFWYCRFGVVHDLLLCNAVGFRLMLNETFDRRPEILYNI